MGKVQLNLHKLIGVTVEEREVMGETQRCIVIPMALNGINESKDGKYIYGHYWANKSLPNPYGRTHFLSVRYPKELKDVYFKVNKLGFWKSVSLAGYIIKDSDNPFAKNKKRKMTVDLDKTLGIDNDK